MYTSDGGSCYHQAAGDPDPNFHPSDCFFPPLLAPAITDRISPRSRFETCEYSGHLLGLTQNQYLQKREKGSRIGQRENLSCDLVLSQPTGSSEAGTTLQSYPLLEQGMDPLYPYTDQSGPRRINDFVWGIFLHHHHFISTRADEGWQLRATFRLHSQQLRGVGDREQVLHFWRKICAVDTTAPTTEEMVKSGNIMKL